MPADTWVCDLCSAFGPAGVNVPCPLCNMKGGALKRTTIHIDTGLFKDINHEFHNFTKACSFSKQKEEYKTPHGVEDQLYYDYFRKSTWKNAKNLLKNNENLNRESIDSCP